MKEKFSKQPVDGGGGNKGIEVRPGEKRGGGRKFAYIKRGPEHIRRMNFGGGKGMLISNLSGNSKGEKTLRLFYLLFQVSSDASRESKNSKMRHEGKESTLENGRGGKRGSYLV